MVEADIAITTATNGFYKMPADMYSTLAVGTFIRYFMRNNTSPRDRNEKFIKGAYIKSRKTCFDGSINLGISLQPINIHSSSSKNTTLKFINTADVEEIWKAYPRDSRVEFLFILNSLNDKEARLRTLEKYIVESDQRLKALENLLMIAISSKHNARVVSV